MRSFGYGTACVHDGLACSVRKREVVSHIAWEEDDGEGGKCEQRQKCQHFPAKKQRLLDCGNERTLLVLVALHFV